MQVLYWHVCCKFSSEVILSCFTANVSSCVVFHFIQLKKYTSLLTLCGGGTLYTCMHMYIYTLTVDKYATTLSDY